MELSVTCHQKRCESFHIFEFKNIQVTKATFNKRKFMKNLVFLVQIRIHVCLPRDTWSLRWEEIILQLFTEVEVVIARSRSSEVNIHHKPPTLRWIIFLVYTKTVRYISTKMMSFSLVLTITILARNDRAAAVVAFSCRQIKLLKAFV